MTTLLAMARTDALAAAVIGGTPPDLFALIRRRPEMETEVCAKLIPNYETQKQAALTARSAILWPEKLNKTTPLLILQGSADWRSDPADTLTFAGKLLACKHPFRLIMFEGGDHNVREFLDEAQKMTCDWLDRYVRDRQPWPSLEPHGP